MSKPRILVTRSARQSSALADHLRALHLEPILIPTIECADPTTFVPLDSALANLDRFDWLLFTSANAVEAFHRRLTSQRGETCAPASANPASISPGGREGSEPLSPVTLPSTLKIAAIGPATARSLEAIGLRPDLVPPQAVAESFAESLLDKIRQPPVGQPDGSVTRFLLIRAETARDHLPDSLRAAGADVTIAPAYRTNIPSGSIEQIKELFSNQTSWPNAITFTSSSTVTNLQALLEASNLGLPPQIPRISIGPITSQTLRDLGLAPHGEAEEPTVASLAAAIVKALGRQPAFGS